MEEDGMKGMGRGGPGVYYYLNGNGCCVQINKQEVIAERLYLFFILNVACLLGWMNIDCEIGIRGDTCQCSALSLGCRRAWGRYRRATVACRHSSALKAATFPLYLPGEACLPFTGLIFVLEPLTIYPLPPPPPPLPLPGSAVSHLLLVLFRSLCLAMPIYTYLLFASLQYIFLSRLCF